MRTRATSSFSGAATQAMSRRTVVDGYTASSIRTDATAEFDDGSGSAQAIHDDGAGSDITDLGAHIGSPLT